MLNPMGLPSREQVVAVVVRLDEWLTPPGAPWVPGVPPVLCPASAAPAHLHDLCSSVSMLQHHS